MLGRGLRYTIYSLVLILFGLIFLSIFISHQVIKNRLEIENLIKKELKMPITIGAVDTEWSYLSPVVALKSVSMVEPGQKLPFVLAAKIRLYPNLWDLIFHQEIVLKKIGLEGLKVSLGWNEKEGFHILDPEGKPIILSKELGSSLDEKQQKVPDIFLIHDAELTWHTPRGILKQTLTGKLYQGKKSGLQWTFKGIQAIEIETHTKTLPMPLKVNVDLTQDEKIVFIKTGTSTLGGTCTLKSSKEHISTDCNIHAKKLDIKSLQAYYKPTEKDKTWVRWLSTAFKKGTLTKSALRITSVDGVIDTAGKFEFDDLTLQYQEGWPDIQDARGGVIIDSNILTAKIAEGYIFDIPFENAKASIEPLITEKTPVLTVDVALETELETGVSFLQSSPLRESLGDPLSSLAPEGPMNLSLNLKIPLQDEKTTVFTLGKLSMQGAKFRIPDSQYELTKVSGDLQFTEKSAQAKGITAVFLNHPLKIGIETIHEQLKISATGLFTSAFLQKHFPNDWLKNLEGKSEFTLSLLMPVENLTKTKPSFLIESNLEGMTVNFPWPLGKTAEEKQPQLLKIEAVEKGERKVTWTIKNLLDAKLVFEQNEQPTLKRGHIEFGKEAVADWSTKDALFISGDIAYLNATDWQAFLDKDDKDTLGSQAPINIHLYAEELDAYGIVLKKVSFSSDFSKNSKIWRLDGPTIQGQVSLPTSEKKELNLEFDFLKMVSEEKESKKSLDNFSDKKMKVSFYCKNLYYNNTSFGTVGLKLIPKENGYSIQNLTATTKTFQITSQGEWNFKRGTALSGKITSSNMAATFADFGYRSEFREAKGVINYQFSWPGSPFDFSLSMVSGQADFQLSNGRILGVDPGFGRILGFLSFETLLKRRTKLDFSDLYKSGFVFDNLKGQFVFKEGLATTEGVSLEGPAARIELRGTANLKTKGLDFRMGVAPKIGTTTLGAGAMLVNPILGGVLTGIGLLNEMSSSKGAIKESYQVTGTWDVPKVDRLNER